MTIEKSEGLVSDLTALLDTEREALLEGDLVQVGALLDSKEALFEKIGALRTHTASDLRELDQKVQRNQLLLGGALEGIQAVTQRMSALKRVQTSLETYGANGRKQDIALKPQSTVERRA